MPLSLRWLIEHCIYLSNYCHNHDVDVTMPANNARLLRMVRRIFGSLNGAVLGSALMPYPPGVAQSLPRGFSCCLLCFVLLSSLSRMSETGFCHSSSLNQLGISGNNKRPDPVDLPRSGRSARKTEPPQWTSMFEALQLSSADRFTNGMSFQSLRRFAGQVPRWVQATQKASGIGLGHTGHLGIKVSGIFALQLRRSAAAWYDCGWGYLSVY